MSANIANLLYLASGVLFILALRGLSHPSTSRQGNIYGMAGMGIAAVTTLMLSPPSGLSGWGLAILGVAIGGGIGAFMAKRVEMTKMPQLVAFFHALVGLAAVFVAAAALYAPQAFGIGAVGKISGASLFEMSLGVAIGALTFTGYSDGTGKEVVDGYVSTGDIGHWDGHGLLHVVGREDDMVVSGGENVAPSRVEDVLATHPAVDEVAVVGIPHEEFGQVLRAVVVPRGEARPDVEELRSLARDQLARHEVPREVWLVDELPRNTTGKVLRRVLAAAGDPAELLRRDEPYRAS